MHGLNLINSLNDLKQIAAAAIQLGMHALLNLVWSDEAYFMFGSTLFYPILASTLLFALTQLLPAGVLDRCKCNCAKCKRLLKLHPIKHKEFLVPVKVLTGMVDSYFL